MSSLVTRKLFKTDELLHMAEAGVFGPEERVELIRGEILSMTPTGAPHAAAVAHTTRTLILTLGDDAVVWIQSTMRLSDDSAPQPDVTVLRRLLGDRRSLALNYGSGVAALVILALMVFKPGA